MVADAKSEAWNCWSEDLNTRDGKNKLFRAASLMRKDKEDVRRPHS